MGDFEKDPTGISTDKTGTNRVSIIALLMTFLAFFAPVVLAGYIYAYDYNVSIQAVIWSIYMSEYSFNFQFFNPFNMIMMVPFLLFRIVSVYQITRYYQGKTTKGRARIGAFLGDAPFLFVYVLFMITAGMTYGFGLNYPLPIMMIVGLLLLWRFPVADVTVPWEGYEETKSWWEETPEEKPEETAEPPDDNQPW